MLESEVFPETTPDCDADPVAGLKMLFVDVVQRGRMAGGQCPVRRPVFLKPHGAARAIFSVAAALPEALRVGVFAREGAFEAWVRFSSDTVPARPDLKTTVGIGIKLFDVPGEKLLPGEPHASTHDFILQNHDVFFVDDAREMCRFTKASLTSEEEGERYLQEHPITREILTAMEKQVPSLLATPYWSVLPYRFGEGRYVKYKLEPVEVPELPENERPPTNGATYLREDLRLRLRRGPARLRFLVQLQTDGETMPLDRATVRWEESASVPVEVATLTIHAQDIEARGQADYGENLAFHPWNTLAEHAPVGTLAEARKVIYSASSHLRRDANGIPTGEPTEPRPIMELPPCRDTKIVRAAIHPAIGIARVGNSREPDGFFFAPEVTDPLPAAPGSRKDAAGALKRQAVKFRIYGYNAAGEAVAELTADNADIRWKVHVANKKAEWFQFQLAVDIPEFAQAADPTRRRNRRVSAEERHKLIIDPGSREIAGCSVQDAKYQFDTGKFFDKEVYLGEVRTDERGRLIFLGGYGQSASKDGAQADTFANNEGWHDDICDGPVTAEVRLAGGAIAVEPAWVASAPPNYAPDVLGVRTQYDLLFDLHAREGRLPRPTTVSFREHIYPILRRMCDLQWVNAGFAAQFGYGAPNHFLEPRFFAQLANPAEEFNELRRTVANTFRHPGRDLISLAPWPWVYGDSMDINTTTPNKNASLTETQLGLIERWARGDFAADWNPEAVPPRKLDDLPVAQRPAMLDRAALDFCLADAFHPGCELTWPMRHGSIYEKPFRIRHRRPDEPEPQFPDPVLTAEIALGPDGPLHAQGPGELTRWMAVPWQTDTASCRAGYEERYDKHLPTFWPARVPNHVLTEHAYRTIMDGKVSRDERVRLFRQRAVWLRGLGPEPTFQDYIENINQMVHEFGKLGVVERREGIANDLDLPPVMFVESAPGFDKSAPPQRGLVLHHIPLPAPGVVEPGVVAPVVAVAPEEPAAPVDERALVGFISKAVRLRPPG